MTQSHPLSILIVEKSGILKSLMIKNFKLEEVYKKCGFKKSGDFIKQVEWSTKYDGKKYFIEVYAKTEGKVNSENKYDFPPPIDTKLFFGNCAILAFIKNNEGTRKYVDLNLILWNKIYEKLFGGFEDLTSTALEDEDEEDELANIPKEKKTKHGYLKDGFVVDTSDDPEEDFSSSNESDDLDDLDEQVENEEDDIIIEDLGSELSEESYDYSDEEEKE